MYGTIVSQNITGTGTLDIRPLDNLRERLPRNAPGIFETNVQMEVISYEYQGYTVQAQVEAGRCQDPQRIKASPILGGQKSFSHLR